MKKMLDIEMLDLLLYLFARMHAKRQSRIVPQILLLCLFIPGLLSAQVNITESSKASDPRSAVNGLLQSEIIPAFIDIESFTVSDHYVQTGSSVTLYWKVTGADTLSIDQGIGDITGSTSTTVTVNTSTTFTLTASRFDGARTATVRVGVGPPRPNIVLFLVDDMGWQDTSEPFLYDSSGNEVITPLNQRYITPNMETLADNGIKFTSAYAMPVCTPSRNCLMTGKNSARHRVTNWTNPDGTDNDLNSTPSHNSPADWISGGLPKCEITLPSLLQSAGYRTIIVGKAHFGATRYARDPLNIGFDVNIAGSAIGNPGSYLGDYGQGSSRSVPHLEAYHNTGTFLTEALTIEMNVAIKDAVSNGVPFFAYMSHYAVHSPFMDDPRFTAHYPNLSGDARSYATLIEGMDKSLGDIMAQLNALGVAEDTLIVFMSDNGGDAPLGDVNNSNTPLRHKKGSKYEGGVRVPLIIAWASPNTSNCFQSTMPIPLGSHTDDIVTIFDLYPTLLGVAGVGFIHDIDGVDLRPYLRNEPGFHRPQELMIHFPHNHRSAYFTIFRQGDWKLIYNYASDSYELYNLETDLSESIDLSGSESERVMRMARKMAQHLNKAGALWPRFFSTGTDDPLMIPYLPMVDVDHDGIPDNREDANSNGLVDPGETNPESSDNLDAVTFPPTLLKSAQ